ncbi:MAG: RNA pseudouridine synthase [Chitinophagaceae bacterium]|nr:RNA pseudouridine synthase [Chitinophagaceae bacterium]
MQKNKVEVLVETEHFIAVNKPSGLLSIPAREGNETSLKDILAEKSGQVWTVHRLDKDTSGVIVFAKSEQSHKYLSGLFEGRSVEKYYTGIVHGTPANNKGSIDAALMEHPAKKGIMVTNKRGKPALTDYEVVECFGSFSLMKFRIHTGRTHQIRVHMKHIGHPIVCDAVYGNGESVLLSSIKKKFNLSKKEEEERPLFNRLALHAERLEFIDEQNTQHILEALLPKDMRALLQQLKKWKAH